MASQSSEITFDLQTVPEFLGLPEERPETHGHGRGDGSFAEDNFIDGARGDTDRAAHGILRDAHGFEILFEKDFTGSDRCVHMV